VGQLSQLFPNGIWIGNAFSNRRHNFKYPLKSAANLIFAMEGFAEFFESVQSFGRCRGAPVGTGLGFRFSEALRDDDLPSGTTACGAGLGGGGSG
jgi:hypothetical protein